MRLRPLLLLFAWLALGIAELPAAVTDGLVALYKFDEASGTMATDAIRGAAGNATLINFGTAPWVAGKFTGAVDADGTNDWISAPDPIANNTTAMSFSGWVWADTRPAWASIAKNWGGSTAGQFHLGLNSTDGRLSNFLTNGTSIVDPTVFPTGSWQHVAFTYDGTTHRLYRNGVQVAALTTTTTLVRSSGVVSFGAKTGNTGTAPDTGSPGYWDGRLDDFGFWNRALSAAEITEIYNAGVQGYGLGQSAKPTIASFAASPSNVAAGGSTVLAWTVQDATTLTLNGGPFSNRDVTGQSSLATTPLNSDTTFTLTATNASGAVSSSRLVGVGANVLEPVISEFLASNDTGIRDAAVGGDHEDWIEIQNPNAQYYLDLGGYHLTDNAGHLDQWTFPAITLPPGGYLVVFASSKDIAIAGQPLHTNFKLSTEGDYLALVKPDGATIVQQFAPAYPPQFTDISYGASGYFAGPTPGAPNSALAGPLISAVTENPPLPLDSDALPIQATVTAQAGGTISTVTLTYRVMYGSEVNIPMVAQGGGVYRAVIPASASTPGQMVRWCVTATDGAARTSRAPLYRDPTNSPQYFGTVVQDSSFSTPLPVIQRFVQDAAGVDGNPGTRCSLLFNGEFFDNVGIRSRGLTSANFPKKSHKVEMNSGHRFCFQADVPRVTEFDLNTTYTDKSYVRAQLTSELQIACGMASPQVFPVQVRQNGQFYSVALFVENPDADFLQRLGLDPEGAFYKAASNNLYTTSATFEKKTRLAETGTADLDALIAALGLTGASLETYVFDNVDLPSMVNYIATTCIAQNIDASDKNHFVYRDTNGTGEWTMLPWDLDLTFGPNALNTDTIVFNQDYASHPFIGARPYVLTTGKYNRFLEAIINTPRSRDMVLRRIRTLTDQFLATNSFQSRIDQLVPLLSADVLQDHATWGASSHFPGNSYTLLDATNRIKNEYLAPRLAWLNAGAEVGIPAGQPGSPVIQFGSYDSRPASGIQDQEYIELVNPNAFSVDISGWTVAGGVTHTVKPGTVMLPGSSIYLSPKPSAFRARTVGPRGGQGIFVQGNVKGHLSNFGETLTLNNPAGTVVSTLTIPPDPSDAQRFLVISKIMYHPAPNGDAEFIELMNISSSVTLDLTGVRFSAGVDFAFPPGFTLAPLARTLVVKNTAIFQSVYGLGKPIAGEFANGTSLSNGGERLALDDATGSTIRSLTYSDTAPWPAEADGAGSLVLIAPLTNPDPNLPQNWRVSVSATGAPAADDAVHFLGVPNGDNDRNGLPDLVDYALGTSASISMTAGSTVVVPRIANADDTEVLPQFSNDLATWQAAEIVSTNAQSITCKAPAGLAGGSRLFFRVLVKLR